MQSERTFAFGVLLRLTTSREGGRHTPLAGGWEPEARFTYRPNWGLPGMVPPEQTGAPVLGFDQEQVSPGDAVRVVIVPPYPAMVPLWSTVDAGESLPMYEGSKICGHGRVLWRQGTTLPLPVDDEERFRRWLLEGSEYDEPHGT